ncbi:MAG: hypothetical protein E6G19_10295 [Actinobacteria bacterium]|nr:MAG: hypothetical protein E6G19_10295 [Actinomycetota bacterium]
MDRRTDSRRRDGGADGRDPRGATRCRREDRRRSGPRRYGFARGARPGAALLSVVPRRDPRDRRRPQILCGETPDAVRIPAGCRFHPRCPIAIDDCKRIDPRLERPAAARAPTHRAACIRV